MVFTSILPQAAADEWISEQYRCALTIPTQESWKEERPQLLPSGEVIYNARSMVSSQGIVIAYVADMPSNDIRKPAVLRRITELLESQGWAVESSSQMMWKGKPFIQYITQRRDVVAGKLIGVSHVAPRGTSLYVITAYGRGEADRAEDPAFLRVMETFRFIEQGEGIADHPEGPSAELYRVAMSGAAGAAALLFAAFAATLFLTRRSGEDRA